MKSFEIYIIEEDFLKKCNLKRKDLYNEFIDMSQPGDSSYSRQFNNIKKKNPRKVFISDNDSLFDKFIQSALKKLGNLVVTGALLFLKFSFKSIVFLLKSSGKILSSIMQYLAEKGSDILSGLYKSLKDYLNSLNEKDGFTKEEKEIIKIYLSDKEKNIKNIF